MLDLATEPTTHRVPIRIDEVRLTPDDGMLFRTDLEEHTVLRNLSILHFRPCTGPLAHPWEEVEWGLATSTIHPPG